VSGCVSVARKMKTVYTQIFFSQAVEDSNHDSCDNQQISVAK